MFSKQLMVEVEIPSRIPRTWRCHVSDVVKVVKVHVNRKSKDGVSEKEER